MITNPTIIKQGGGANATSGTITFAVQPTSKTLIPHGLGRVPNYVVVWSDTIGTIATISALRGGLRITDKNVALGFYTRVNNSKITVELSEYFSVDETNITLIVGGSYHWEAGATIHWTAVITD